MSDPVVVTRRGPPPSFDDVFAGAYKGLLQARKQRGAFNTGIKSPIGAYARQSSLKEFAEGLQSLDPRTQAIVIDALTNANVHNP